MKKYLILPLLVMCTLSALAAGSGYYEYPEPRQQKRIQKVDQLVLKMAEMELETERLRLAREKEKNRHEEAMMRAPSGRGQAGNRELPKVKFWTREDAEEAYRQAEAGNARRGCQLGIMHEFGYAGKPINLKKAANNYKRAIKAGITDAISFLERVENKLESEEWPD